MTHAGDTPKPQRIRRSAPRVATPGVNDCSTSSSSGYVSALDPRLSYPKSKVSGIKFTSEGSCKGQYPRSSNDRKSKAPAYISSDVLFCPICVEKFDDLELRFYPCPCRYRVCSMCVHLIKEKADGNCPNCRSLYVDEHVRVEASIPIDVLQLLKNANDSKGKERSQKPRSKDPSSQVTSARGRRGAKGCRHFPKECKTRPVGASTIKVPVIPEIVSDIKLTRFTGGISVWD